MLSQLEAGELFCMDRGYAWTLESEGDRRTIIVDWFHELPTLRQRLPLMWSYIEANQTIANRGNTLIEEIDRPPG